MKLKRKTKLVEIVDNLVTEKGEEIGSGETYTFKIKPLTPKDFFDLNKSNPAFFSASLEQENGNEETTPEEEAEKTVKQLDMMYVLLTKCAIYIEDNTEYPLAITITDEDKQADVSLIPLGVITKLFAEVQTSSGFFRK